MLQNNPTLKTNIDQLWNKFWSGGITNPLTAIEQITYLLSEIATAGKNGQFRTPRHIIKLIAELVQPQIGQRIADPACGTGGFLLGAYQYVVTQLAKKVRVKIERIRNSQNGLGGGILITLSKSPIHVSLIQSLIQFSFDEASCVIRQYSTSMVIKTYACNITLAYRKQFSACQAGRVNNPAG